jgi:hypothetical protein
MEKLRRNGISPMLSGQIRISPLPDGIGAMRRKGSAKNGSDTGIFEK